MQAIVVPSIYIILAAGIALLLMYVMKALSKNFLTLYVFVRAFKIFDLEFAASPLELSTYVKGIFDDQLPADVSKKTGQSLKQFFTLSIISQVFIAAVLFFTCNRIASHHIHTTLFLLLGWAQLVSLVCGVFKAIFFLGYIHRSPKLLQYRKFKMYQFMEIIKWAIPLTTVVVIASIFLYLWFSGLLNLSLLHNFLILVVVAIVVFLVKKYIIKTKEVDLESFREIGN